MALHEVLHALEAEARARCASIAADAAAESEAVAARARASCEEIIRRRLDAHTGEVAVRTRRLVDDARLEARHEIAALREALVERVFDAAAEALAHARDRADYHSVLDGLLDAALSESEHPTSVSCDSRDVDLVTKMLAQRGLDLPVRADVHTAAGVVVRSHEDRVTHDNTAETRLERLRAATRERVGELLTE